MTENPYDILGVSREASLDEVKKAYRKKARENHPDLNPDDPQAAERIKKINEAYDRICNPEKYAREDARRRGYGAPYSPGYQQYGGSPQGGTYNPNTRQNTYGGGSTYEWVEINWEDLFRGAYGSTGYGSWGRVNSIPVQPEVDAHDTAEMRQVVQLINLGQYLSALSLLERIPTSQMNARWYYLCALASYGAGRTVQAMMNINRALSIEPNNSSYTAFKDLLHQQAKAYEEEGTRQGFSMRTLDPASLCCCICMAPVVCRMFSACLNR